MTGVKPRPLFSKGKSTFTIFYTFKTNQLEEFSSAAQTIQHNYLEVNCKSSTFHAQKLATEIFAVQPNFNLSLGSLVCFIISVFAVLSNLLDEIVPARSKEIILFLLCFTITSFLTFWEIEIFHLLSSHPVSSRSESDSLAQQTS